MIDLGAVGVRGNPVYHQRIFGDPRSPSVRNIPARSPSVAIVGKVTAAALPNWCSRSCRWRAGQHDCGRAHRCGDAHGKRRVTLISAPDAKRGPVVYDDPGDANGAVAGAPQRLAPCVGPAFGGQSLASGHGAIETPTSIPRVEAVATANAQARRAAVGQLHIHHSG
jgi:hypothetical protein